MAFVHKEEPLDNKTKRRWCGYCGEHHIQNGIEFLAHLTSCEKLLVQYLRRTSSDGTEKK